MTVLMKRFTPVPPSITAVVSMPVSMGAPCLSVVLLVRHTLSLDVSSALAVMTSAPVHRSTVETGSI